MARLKVTDADLRACLEAGHTQAAAAGGRGPPAARTATRDLADVDLRVVKEFQDTVVEISRELEPEVARRIRDRPKARRALRPSADLPSLDRGGIDGAMA